MRIGILTGGGDCPGLNAVIRAVVRKGSVDHGDEFVGFLDAWDGVREKRFIELTVGTMRGMLPKGGTIIGTRRGSPYDHADGPQRVREVCDELGLDGFVVIGGNGALSVAARLHAEIGLPVVGVPKTIDNDVEGTDVCFGFHTAVQTATDAIDRLHTTAESHDRVIVVEVMGRDTGWIATYAGIAGGATAILIPERPFDIDAVAEVVTRRGGTPSAVDRVLCTRLGVAATQALHDGVTGQMVAVRNDEIVRTPLTGVIGKTRFVDLSIYDNVASVFFG